MQTRRTLLFITIICYSLTYTMEENPAINYEEAKGLLPKDKNKQKTISKKKADLYKYTCAEEAFCDFGICWDKETEVTMHPITRAWYFIKYPVTIVLSACGIVPEIVMPIFMFTSCSNLNENSSGYRSQDISCTEQDHWITAGKVMLPVIVSAQLYLLSKLVCAPFCCTYLDYSRQKSRAPKLKAPKKSNPKLLWNRYEHIPKNKLEELITFYYDSSYKNNKKNNALIARLQEHATENCFESYKNIIPYDTKKEKEKDNKTIQSFLHLLPSEILTEIFEFKKQNYRNIDIAQLIHAIRQNCTDTLYNENNAELTVQNAKEEELYIPSNIMHIYEDYMPEDGYKLSHHCKIIEYDSDSEEEPLD